MIATRKQEKPRAPRGQERKDNLTDKDSDVCPGCGRRLVFWACEAVCHHCGLKFTCDE